jgi:short-subunit dehydrogenase
MAAVVRKLTSLAVDPLVLGPFLWAITRGPPSVRDPLLEQLTKVLGSERIGKFIYALQWAVALGLVGKVNRRLNQWALNNWSWSNQKSKWVWHREIAVLTGGCSGIGLETAKLLKAKGIKVAILDVNPLPAELQNYSNVKYFHCDVTSPDSIRKAAAAVRDQLGEPSILINNAGVGRPHTILDTTDEWLDTIFRINITSHFTLAREFMPAMIKANKGHIVGLASMASFVTSPGIVDYASTKAAVMAFHEGLNQEIRWIYMTPGVLNTVVHPYWARTGLVRGFESHLEKTQGGMMNPNVIAKKIVGQIVSCKGGQIIIPRHMATGSLLRGFPNWLQEFIRDGAVGRAAAHFPGTRS